MSEFDSHHPAINLMNDGEERNRCLGSAVEVLNNPQGETGICQIIQIFHVGTWDQSQSYFSIFVNKMLIPVG